MYVWNFKPKLKPFFKLFKAKFFPFTIAPLSEYIVWLCDTQVLLFIRTVFPNSNPQQSSKKETSHVFVNAQKHIWNGILSIDDRTDRRRRGPNAVRMSGKERFRQRQWKLEIYLYEAASFKTTMGWPIRSGICFGIWEISEGEEERERERESQRSMRESGGKWQRRSRRPFSKACQQHSESHPTLYVVHRSAKPVLHGPNNTETKLFHHGKNTFMVGWLSENAAGML